MLVATAAGEHITTVFNLKLNLFFLILLKNIGHFSIHCSFLISCIRTKACMQPTIQYLYKSVFNIHNVFKI